MYIELGQVKDEEAIPKLQKRYDTLKAQYEEIARNATIPGCPWLDDYNSGLL